MYILKCTQDDDEVIGGLYRAVRDTDRHKYFPCLRLYRRENSLHVANYGREIFHGQIEDENFVICSWKNQNIFIRCDKVLTVVQYGADCATNVIHGTEFDTCSITWISFASIFVFAGNICSIGTTLSHNLLLLLQIL